MATDDKPKLQRTGTMQATAEEGIAFCEKGGLDWREGGFVKPGDENSNEISGEAEAAVQNEEENAGPDETEPAPLAAGKLKRQSTMAATAEEGNEFLTRTLGSTTPDDSEDGASGVSSESSSKKPKLQRDSTMDVTAQEGNDFIERMGGLVEDEPASEKDSSIKTVAFTEGVDKDTSKRGSRPKIQRNSTIDVTVKEAEMFLSRSGGIEEEKKKKEKGDEKDGGEPSVSPPQLRRDLTMKETAKIGEEFVGEQHLTGSRNQTKLLRESEKTEVKRYRRASLKRTTSMDVTAAEGEEFVKRKKK